MNVIQSSYIEGPDGFPMRNKKWCSASQELMQVIKGVKKVCLSNRDLDNFKDELWQNDRCKRYTLNQIYTASKKVDLLIYVPYAKRPNYMKVAFLPENMKDAYLIDRLENDHFGKYIKTYSVRDCITGILLQYKKEDIRAFCLLHYLDNEHHIEIKDQVGERRDEIYNQPSVQEIITKFMKKFEKIWESANKIIKKLKEEEVPEEWIKYVRPFPEF